MATRADEAENVTNVEVKAAVSDLEAHVVSTSHAAAQQRDVAVPIQAGVHMHHAFGLAGAAAGMDIIRSVARLCCSVVEGHFQKLLQFGPRLLCNIVVAEGGEEGRGSRDGRGKGQGRRCGAQRVCVDDDDVNAFRNSVGFRQG